MSTRRASLTFIIAVFVALALAPGLAGAEPRFEPNRTAERMAHYQIIKAQVIERPLSDVVIDFEMMKFIEENTLGYHLPVAQFTELDTVDDSQASPSPCQGEGLVNDDAVRADINGLIADYCSGEIFADFFGNQSSDEPLIPVSPADWPVDFGPY